MNLLIDIGNTKVKWAVTDGPGLSGHGSVAHHRDPVAALRAQSLPPAAAVWVSCVHSVDREAVASGLRQLTGQTPNLARSEARCDGLVNSYPEPARMGTDRWLAMLALWSQRRAAFCLVGAGTALTLDRVDEGGQHLGGLIAPGLTSMQHSLLSVTNGRPASLVRPYGHHLGRDTEAAVRQAAMFACLGVIERGLRAPGATAGEARILTGGDATDLLPQLDAGWEHRPHLVLEGLQVLARQAGSGAAPAERSRV